MKNSAADNNNVKCGNCWGHQEYEGEITSKKAKPVSNAKDGFILEFAKKIANPK